jgi:hypothetical protein
MRMWSRSAALVVFALALAVSVPAVGDKLLFSGTHAIRFSHNGQIKEVSASSAGVSEVATVNGKAGPLNTIQLTRPFAKITDTVTATSLGTGIDEIRFENVRINPKLAGPLGAPGKFAKVNAAAKGAPLTINTLPAQGTIRLCNVIGCPGSVVVDLEQTMGGVAVGPGVGGKFIAQGMTGTETGPTLTVTGHPWTVNTTVVNYQTPMGGLGMLSGMGFACGPAGLTTMGDACAVNGNGTTLNFTMGMGGILQLVSGIQTTCAGCGGNNATSGQITRLTIRFAPEPRWFALLGVGAAGLVLLGRTRTRA